MDHVLTRQARIAQLAREDHSRCFTSLNHHLDLPWMLEALSRIRKDAAVGVDNVTAAEYAQNLSENLERLLDDAKSGRYFAPPVRRKHLPKGNGETRPIGVPSYEDKLLQRAVSMALEPIYEQDFYPCSFGFRPELCAHDALDMVWQQMGGAGCWVLEVDLRKYFDTIQWTHLRTFLDQRVRDGVLRRLINKWLKAGVCEDGALSFPSEGTPQGGVISPLLSNIYLHEVLDRWFHEEVCPRLRGQAFLVRYADDFVIGCDRLDDAERLFAVLPKRFARFGLTVHPEKSRLVDFRSPQARGSEGAGQTFDFLGFTHYWGKSQTGRALVKRRTARGRLRRKLADISAWCRANRHQPLREQARTLARKLTGHYQYYGVTANDRQLRRFRRGVERVWHSWLNRRTRGRVMSWAVFRARVLAVHRLPPPQLTWTIRRLTARREERRLLPGFRAAFT